MSSYLNAYPNKFLKQNPSSHSAIHTFFACIAYLAFSKMILKVN